MSGKWILLLALLLLPACGGGGGSSSTPSSKSITSFSFTTSSNPALLSDVVATIDSINNTISVTFPSGTDLTDLVADFSITGDYISVGGLVQDSGLTVNDFSTGPLTYVVVAQDGTSRDYTVTANMLSWYQDAYLKASNSAAGDQFGNSIASGSGTIVTGAMFEGSSSTAIFNSDNSAALDNLGSENGAAYVFKQDGNNWAQDAYLKASNGDAGDWFGVGVSTGEGLIAVGAYGEDSSSKLIDNNNGSPSSVNNSLSNSGAVYLFKKNVSDDWFQDAYLKAPNSDVDDWFGTSVALSVDMVAVGAPNEDSNPITINTGLASIDNSLTDSGAVYLFKNSSDIWSLDAFLKASNRSSSQGFGHDVAMSSDRVLIGAPGESSSAIGVVNTNNSASGDTTAVSSGAAYVFLRDGSGNWFQDAYVKAFNTDSGDGFGSAVAISDDLIVVGAPHERSSGTGIDSPDSDDNSLVDAGAAYVFERDGSGNWVQDAYLKPSNTAANSLFGSAVAISGNTVLVGAPGESSGTTGIDNVDGSAASDLSAGSSGAVYVFKRDETGFWVQDAYFKSSNSDSGDLFGTSVSVSGTTVAAGSIAESAAETTIDNVDDSASADNSATDAGAAYIFSVK